MSEVRRRCPNCSRITMQERMGKLWRCVRCQQLHGDTTIYDTPSVRDASGAMKGSEQLAAEVSRRIQKEAQE